MCGGDPAAAAAAHARNRPSHAGSAWETGLQRLANLGKTLNLESSQLFTLVVTST
jgi:hypothetical protein